MRIFCTLLAYNRTHTVLGALENFDNTTTDSEHRRMIKTIFDPGYPLPSQEENSKELKRLAVEFGWWCTQIPNEGVVQNHNRAIHDFYRMEKGDYYVIHDPDVRIQDKGYVSAAIQALESDPDIVFVCPSREFSHEDWYKEAHGAEVYELQSGLKLRKHKELAAWSCGVFKGEFLASRDRNFLAWNSIYGYGEHADYERMKEMGKKWVQLVDFRDYHLGAPDAEYTEWKHQSAAQKTKKTFDIWLKERK